MIGLLIMLAFESMGMANLGWLFNETAGSRNEVVPCSLIQRGYGMSTVYIVARNQPVIRASSIHSS